MATEQNNLVKQYISDEFTIKDIEVVKKFISELNEKLKSVCEIVIKSDTYSVDLTLVVLTINVCEEDFYLGEFIIDDTPLPILLMRKLDTVVTRKIDLMTFVIIYTEVCGPEIIYFYRPDDVCAVDGEDHNYEFIYKESHTCTGIVSNEVYDLENLNYFNNDGRVKLLKIKKGV